MKGNTKRSRHFYLVRVWFAANVLLALCPPLYWAADAHREAAVWGMPVTLFYFLVISISITASILYAYWEESASGEFAP
jgi:hypothetical protein